MTYEKSCGALVIRRERREDGEDKSYVLMIKHVKGGHRSFPKGHVEAGESEIQTAEREVLEETGVPINITESFRHTVNYSPRPTVRKDVVYFLAFTEQKNITAQVGEVAEVEWIELERAEKCLTHENDKNILRRAIEYIAQKNLLRVE